MHSDMNRKMTHDMTIAVPRLMTRIPTWLFLGMFLLAGKDLPAQIFGPAPDGEGKTWNIRFIVDPGLNTWRAGYRDMYEGERYFPETDSTSMQWRWASWDSVDRNVLDYYKAGSLRLGILLNVYDELYVGVNYVGYIVQGYPRNLGLSYVYWPFFSLSGSVNYNYRLPWLNERLSLQPTLSLGTYQSERSFEGIGQELAYEGRLGLAYRYNRRSQNQIRVWGNYQRLTYRASEPSLVFPERQREVASTWDLFSVGVGFIWHLQIQEDPEDRDQDQRSRKKRKARRLEHKQDKLQRKLDKVDS